MTIEVPVLTVLKIDSYDGTYEIDEKGPCCLLCMESQRQAGRAHLSLRFSVDSRYEKALREVLGLRGNIERQGPVLKVWVRSCAAHRHFLDGIYGCADEKRIVHIIDLRPNASDCKVIVVSVD